MNWISVEDRLPKTGEQVLVYCKKIQGEIDYESGAAVAKVVWGCAEQSSIVDCDYYSVYAFGITHWMPPPKPPTK